MKVRHGGRRLVLQAFLLLVVLSGGVGMFGARRASAAEEPISSGWWWAGRPSQTVLVRLDPVPAVPEGGMYVSSDPSGARGVSALRVQLHRDASDVVLTLAVEETIGPPFVDACPAATAWEPQDGGTWDQRPLEDCESARVSGVPNEDGSALAFDLDPLLRDGALDIVLTPGAQGGANVAPTFATAFRRPDGNALSVRSDGTPQTDTAEPSTMTEPLYGAPPRGVLPAITPLRPVPQEATLPVRAAANGTTRSPFAVDVAEGFRYSVVLVMPLALLVGASYVGWVLTRPVVVASPDRTRGNHAA